MVLDLNIIVFATYNERGAESLGFSLYLKSNRSIDHFIPPPHDSGGVLCFHVERPCVRPYVRILNFHQTWYVHGYCGDLLWDC